MRKRIAITMGDVNGIGPEILAKALARASVRDAAEICVLGSASVYERARSGVAGAPRARVVRSLSDAAGTAQVQQAHEADAESIPFVECGAGDVVYRPGRLDSRAGRCAMTWLSEAVDLALAGEMDAIVTCPINKEGIHRAGFSVSGHTDFIAERTGAAEYRMCLFAGPLRVVHLTGHLSLRDALGAVNRDAIAASLRLGRQALLRLDIHHPRIGVAGLNPHAGEAGAFGREEIEEIAPAVRECAREGIDCSGPHAPDTVFRRMFEGEFDMVIAMYHDQGHIPLKLIARDDAVNVTLGLPIVRTSVGHGTAYDIAGKHVASEASLCAAIDLAIRLSERRTPIHL